MSKHSEMTQCKAMPCHSLAHKMQLLVGLKCLNRCHPLGDMSSAPNINNGSNNKKKPTEWNAHGKGHGQSKIQKFFIQIVHKEREKNRPNKYINTTATNFVA